MSPVNRISSTLCNLPPVYAALLLFLIVFAAYLVNPADAMVAEFCRYLLVTVLSLMGVNPGLRARSPLPPRPAPPEPATMSVVVNPTAPPRSDPEKTLPE